MSDRMILYVYVSLFVRCFMFMSHCLYDLPRLCLAVYKTFHVYVSLFVMFHTYLLFVKFRKSEDMLFVRRSTSIPDCTVMRECVWVFHVYAELFITFYRLSVILSQVLRI